MGKTKVELNSAGVQAILKSAEMQKVCNEHASVIQSRCGDGYESDSYRGKTRVNAMVWADTPQAKADNAKNKTILRALR